MKNLENYGVQQLNTKEMSKIEGGFLLTLLLGIAAGVIISFVAKGIKDNQ